MKKKTSQNRLFSILLTLVMVVSLIPMTAFAATTIDEMFYTISLPKRGDAWYSVATKYKPYASWDFVGWYRYEDSTAKLIGDGDAFIGGYTYGFRVRTSLNPGWQIGPSTDIKINDQTPTSLGDNVYEITFEIPIINIFSASATVKAPIAGALPNYSAVSGNSEQYTATVKNWYIAEGGRNYPLNYNEAFELGKAYVTEVTFKEKAGSTFKSSTEYLINGQTAIDNGSGGQEARFIASQLITNVYATIDFPKEGETINDTSVSVSSDSHCTVTVQRWYDTSTNTPMMPTDVFQGGKIYGMVVKINPMSGYGVNETSIVKTQDGASLTVFSDDTFIKYYVVPTNITSATATVIEPKEGAKPDMSPVSGDSTKYNVSVEGWYRYEGTNGYKMSSTDVFEGGKEYGARLIFTPKRDYEIPDSATVKINGKTATLYTGGGRQVVFLVNQTISTANVTGIEKPIADQLADFSADNTAKYTVENIKWYCPEEGMYIADDEPVTGNRTLRCTFTLKPKEGYKFTADTAVDVPVYNYYNLSTSLSGDNLSVTFYVWIDYCYLTDFNIYGITPPAVGQHPDFTAQSADDKIIITNVVWTALFDTYEALTATDTFQAGKPYDCSVYFTGNDEKGYWLNNSNHTATFNGVTLPSADIWVKTGGNLGSVQKEFTPVAADEFYAITDVDLDEESVYITCCKAGTYTVCFVDYDGQKLNNLLLLSSDLTAGNNKLMMPNTFTLSTGDKIFLWESLETIHPLCNAYVIE